MGGGFGVDKDFAAMTKLALGTVQFGLGYGVKNKSGQTSFAEAGKIWSVAKIAGIDLIDTAIAYGESEQVIGGLGVEGFKVVTKLPPIPVYIDDVAGWAEYQVSHSLRRLGVESVYALLLHRSSDFLQEHGRSLIGALDNLRKKGLVEKIGVSIYDPSELDSLLKIVEIGLVQAPLNLIDDRLESSGWLQRLEEQNIEVHTRSAFLQGLLLMEREEIPAKFERWSSLWDEWHRQLTMSKTSAVAACLSYPLSLRQVSRVVVGVETAEQLEWLIKAAGGPFVNQDWTFMRLQDPILMNPSNWCAI